MGSFDESEKNRALNEIRLLASLRHPNIIRFKECFYDEEAAIINVVTEYAERGDLQKKIKSYQRQPNMRIGEEELWRILFDVAKGIGLLLAQGWNTFIRIIFCIGILSQPTSWKARRDIRSLTSILLKW